MLKNKLYIKIPIFIKCFVNSSDNVLILKKQKNVFITNYCCKIFIKNNNILFYSVSSKKKFIKLLYSIREFIYSKKNLYYKKIILTGVGYRFNVIKNTKSILKLNLGYSHSIYIKIPDTISIFYINTTTIYLSSFDYLKLNNISNYIKKFRVPEPYKGKGIKFEYDFIKIKEGKKNLIG